MNYNSIPDEDIVPFKGQVYKEVISRLNKERRRTGKKVLFNDPEFPPERSSLGNLNSLTNLLNSETLHRGKQVNVEWYRIPDLPHLNGSLTSKQTPYVFYSDGENSRKRLKQGEIGNCWYCAVATTLSCHYESFSNPKEDINHSRFKSDEYFGIFQFLFFHFGKWYSVIIDDYLPTVNGKLIFSNSKDPNEFWPALLEKAYAKYMGSYEKLDGGCPLTAALHFIDGFGEFFKTSDYKSNDKIQELFEDLNAVTGKSSIVTCSSYSIREAEGETASKLGILPSHAYTVMGLNQFEIGGKTIQLIRIYNPWGKEEWMGAWSDYSDEMKSLPSIKKQRLGLDIGALDDGEFYMEMSDFVKYFESIQIVTQKPKEFRKCNLPIQKEQFRGFWKSGEEDPQYLVKNISAVDSKCVIKLSQTKDVEDENLLSIGLKVFMIGDEMGTRLGQQIFEEGKLPETNFFNTPFQVTFTFKMEPGSSFVIVPSTYTSNENGQFLIRFVSDQVFECEVKP